MQYLYFTEKMQHTTSSIARVTVAEAVVQETIQQRFVITIWWPRLPISNEARQLIEIEKDVYKNIDKLHLAAPLIKPGLCISFVVYICVYVILTKNIRIVTCASK
ncbi:hypothetical protein L211DRAFT_163041 [Terfezia boudieri ATCC MYA-4762]|uniref:Uncharacterized protein n=1 Tax=Terfezia boudieri ATCC MYA-4762 TaxID=1051890 RepID=A0A3N4LNF9_9PEZI|nr:hypothetical protein L211DRAFT_163041 [Terfezia boudieri ATCC MYA-4762]